MPIIISLRKNIQEGGEQKFYVYFHGPADVRKMAYLVWKHVADDEDELETVLRGAAENDPDPERRGLLVEQTERIDQIVRYQRQRAAVAGSNGVVPTIGLAPIVQRLISGLDKVHGARGVRCELDIDADLQLRADQGDLFELFGNLLENAYKHARARIVVKVRKTAEHLQIRIEDDGPGIPVDDATRLLKRGQRADQRHAGEGIGLAVVNEIVSQYDGELSIGRATLGGAMIEVALPR